MASVDEAAGCSEDLLRLPEAWHRRVMADEMVSHAFSDSPRTGGGARRPATYGDQTSVVRIHSGNGHTKKWIAERSRTSLRRPSKLPQPRAASLTQAWSPIDGITFYPGYGEDRKSVLDDSTIQDIAAKVSKTAAQAMLRWHMQQGRSATPKPTAPSRIAENFDLFDFTLSDGDLARLDALDTGHRDGPGPDETGPSTWDLEVPEA